MNSAGVTVVWSELMHHWCAVMGCWIGGKPRLAMGFSDTPEQATLIMFEDLSQIIEQGKKI